MIYFSGNKNRQPGILLMRIAICLIFLLLTPLNQALAGTLSGQITYSGKAPAAKITKTGRYAKACGPEIVSQSLIIENKGIKNAVVWITGKDAKKLDKTPGEYVLNQENCRYSPHVTAMSVESELEIISNDPFNHNIHTFSFDNDPINIMFMPGMSHEQEFDEPEVIKVECDLHGWMEAWIVVTANSFFATTRADGTYEIPGLPPGKYTVNAWHEVLGTMTQKIKIAEDDLEVNFGFPKVSAEVLEK